MNINDMFSQTNAAIFGAAAAIRKKKFVPSVGGSCVIGMYILVFHFMFTEHLLQLSNQENKE